MFQIKWVLFLKILFNQVWSGCTFVPFAGLIIWQWYETFNGSGNFAPWGLFFWYALVAPLPHTSLIDGAWGRTFQKLSHLGRGYKVFPLERRDKPERGGGVGGREVDVELYSSITFTVCEEKGSLYYFLDLQSFELALQGSDPTLYCTKTWYHMYISDPFW